MLRPGSCLISMLHYPTRPKRVKKLIELGINAISLDEIVDDRNLRLVENMSAVAWNGLDVAYGILEKKWPYLCRPNGNPFKVLILGTGMVGKHAVDAATKLGNHKRNSEHMQRNGPGSLGISVDQNITYHERTMQELFHDTDILVDATKRRDASKPVIPNHWIAWLPDHAVLVDLAVDPYTMDTNPPVVRGLEGIPQGNLDKYIFTPDDPDWDKSVPDSISSDQRRTVVSCYSWPGIHPVSCMQHYQQQLAPLMEILLRKGYDNLSLQGEYFGRALYRATLRHWIEDNL